MNFHFSEISSLLDHSFGGVVSDFRGVETHLGEPRRGIHFRGVSGIVGTPLEGVRTPLVRVGILI